MTSTVVEVLVTVGAVLLGGILSYLASLRVDRMRLTREMRVRLYDEYIVEARELLARWRSISEDGKLFAEDLRQRALSALAQVRRAAVVAGRADRRKVKTLKTAHDALADVHAEIDPKPGGGRRQRWISEAEDQTTVALNVLKDYAGWLEKRLS